MLRSAPSMTAPACRGAGEAATLAPMTSVNGKRIVVLGGAGFLGSHLCERLVRDGAAEVVCVDNLITGSERNVKELELLGKVRFVRHDITLPLDVGGPVELV